MNCDIQFESITYNRYITVFKSLYEQIKAPMHVSYSLKNCSVSAEHNTWPQIFQKRAEERICRERRDEAVGGEGKEK